MASSSTLPRRRTRALPALAALLFALTPSCKLLSSAANAPTNIASGLLGGKSKDKVPPNVVQAGVMRFADTFAARITQATQDFGKKAGTPEARIQGMTWAIGQSTAAFTTASGPNSNLALLDLVVLTTLGRMVHEEYWLPKVWGEADRPMVEAFTALEKDIWAVAAQLLTPEQQELVRTALRDWRAENPDMGITAFVRLPTFEDIAAARKSAKSNTTHTPGLGDLLNLDPLSGLEPAVREIEQTRLFGERAMFYMQRAPIILSNQIELLGMKLMIVPEVHSALADSERISKAAESIADTAVKLPEAVRVEREAAVKQISDELTVQRRGITDELTLQRQGIVADLEKVQEPASKILTDAHATLEAGEKMSIALDAAIKTLDGFIAGFQTEPPPPGSPPPLPGPPGKPFDVTEYGAAATQVAGAARELNGLVATLDASLPKVQQTFDEAAARGDRVVDYAFQRGLQLGVILIGAAAIAVILVCWIASRFRASRAPQVR